MIGVVVDGVGALLEPEVLVGEVAVGDVGVAVGEFEPEGGLSV